MFVKILHLYFSLASVLSCNFLDASLALAPGSPPFFSCPDLFVLYNVSLYFVKIETDANSILMVGSFTFFSRPEIANRFYLMGQF